MTVAGSAYLNLPLRSLAQARADIFDAQCLRRFRRYAALCGLPESVRLRITRGQISKTAADLVIAEQIAFEDRLLAKIEAELAEGRMQEEAQ